MKGTISKLTKEELETLITAAQSMKQVLEGLGLRAAGGNFKSLQKHCSDLGIDLGEIRQRTSLIRSATLKHFEKMNLNTVLVIQSSVSRSHLKKRLISDGLLQNNCSVCGTPPEWNGVPLSLQLDHINGIWNDNRLENLRLLCPNCHSQTGTFAGKALKKEPVVRRAVPRKTKIEWPSFDKLKEMIEASGFVGVGRELGVSDVAVHKRYKKYLGEV